MTRVWRHFCPRNTEISQDASAQDEEGSGEMHGWNTGLPSSWQFWEVSDEARVSGSEKKQCFFTKGTAMHWNCLLQGAANANVSMGSRTGHVCEWKAWCTWQTQKPVELQNGKSWENIWRKYLCLRLYMLLFLFQISQYPLLAIVKYRTLG